MFPNYSIFSDYKYFDHFQGIFSINGSISRIGVVGVTTIAILSGLGAIYTPYKFVRFFRQEVSPLQVEQLRTQLERQRDMLNRKVKQRELKSKALNASSQARRRGGFFWSSGGNGNGLEAIDEDISAMQTVVGQMEGNLEELEQLQKRHKEASTLYGRAKHFVGLGLVAFCVFRLVTSGIRVLAMVTMRGVQGTWIL
eukprot:m.46748 g.46748  ORF g.46748 m.46748 type:complete len:197 (-) comp10735_c0_seq9:472-1062(-)